MSCRLCLFSRYDPSNFSKTNHDLTEVNFVHLHNHTQFSVLQSTIAVKDLVAAAVQQKMPAVAMTDHANLMDDFLS